MKHPQLAGRGAVAVAIAIAIATPIVITNAIANCHYNCIVRPPGTHLDGPNAMNGTNAIAWASAPHGQAGCGAGPDRSHLRAHKHRQSAMIKPRLGISPPPLRLGSGLAYFGGKQGIIKTPDLPSGKDVRATRLN